MKKSKVLAILAAGMVFPASVALAGEKTLEFRLITKYLDARTIDAPNVENQTITQTKAFGVAVFKDGRIATKDFVTAVDSNKGVGTSYGYSTYTFDDGSTVTARYVYEFNGSQGHGDYTITFGNWRLCRRYWKRHV